MTKMISASPVEQGTLALFPAGWEIEAHTGLNDLLTGTKALVRSPVPSLLLRDLRHTQSKEEEEVTHNLLGVVQLPRLSLQSLPTCLCWTPGFHLSLWIYPSAELETQGKGLNSKAALQEKQGSVLKARGICQRHHMSLCLSVGLLFHPVLPPNSEGSHARRTIKFPPRCLCSLLETITGKSTTSGRRF